MHTSARVGELSEAAVGGGGVASAIDERGSDKQCRNRDGMEADKPKRKVCSGLLLLGCVGSKLRRVIVNADAITHLLRPAAVKGGTRVVGTSPEH